MLATAKTLMVNMTKARPDKEILLTQNTEINEDGGERMVEI